MKYQFIYGLSLLMGSSAMAQTPVSSQTQITQTRDYVTGLIKNVSNIGNERFSKSKDYAVSGKALQARLTKALEDFRDSMSLLSEGAFALQVEQYNRLVLDTSLSESAKRDALAGAKASLLNQVNLATSTFQAALSSLYRIEPHWVIEEARRTNDRYKVTFASGFSTRTTDGYESVRAKIKDRISETLESACRSKLCYSLLLSDYSSFLSDVRYKLDSPIVIPLADGSLITIDGLMQGLANNRPPKGNSFDRGYLEFDLMDTVENVSNYVFTSEYQKLPNKI